MPPKTTADARVFSSLVFRHHPVFSDGSDTMENRDKAREIYIQQRENFEAEAREKREEEAKDKAWMRQQAGLPAQTKKT
jgi:hypothetical protein